MIDPAVGQRLRRFEERHDVEDELAGIGGGGEVEHVRDVACRRRERDDVPRDRLLPELALHAADRPEGLEDLVPPGPRLLGVAGAAIPGREGPPMDRRVLPDLERREVEAEGLDLPAEVVDLAPGRAREPRVDERVLDLDQLVEQLRRARVARRRRAATLAEQPDAGVAQALGDEREPLPERLVREPLRQRPRQVRHRELVGDQAMDERRRDGVATDLRRDGLGESRGNGFVAAQDVVGLDPDGLLGDRRR